MNNYYFELTLKKPNGNIIVKKFGRPITNIPGGMPLYEEVYNVIKVCELFYPMLKIVYIRIIVGDPNETEI